MVTTINGHHVELVEVDTLGYDVYIDNADEPINLVYFTSEPTWKDIWDRLDTYLS